MLKDVYSLLLGRLIFSVLMIYFPGKRSYLRILGQCKRRYNFNIHLAPESLGLQHTQLHRIFWLIRCSNMTKSVSNIANRDPASQTTGFHSIQFEQFALLGGLARLTPRLLTEQSHHSWPNLMFAINLK